MRHIILTVAALVFAVGLSGQANADETRTITMTGEGSVAVKPDILRITAGVTVHETEAADAFRIMSDTLNQVADVLGENGIAPIDIQTSQLTLGERYGQNRENLNAEQVVIGYTAASSLTVVVRDLDQAGDIVDVLVTRGANQIRGFEFDIADPSEALEQARIAAVQDAIAKTALYTEAAQVKAGDILTISETAGSVDRPQQMFDMAAMGRSLPVEGGSLSVSARVSIITEIE
ncbi:hypothetical protein FHS72_002363 [Loktanella ponticola]|uniref:DUF541 domain-containing protein n=1 Tax=Yoonia ponticola TaxID=1524255 RepID=A0A7W9BLH9_9RHOB|nr:SIMPL domain-containing protein [Yoonia ponticola]MBB5722733.1 hypothetical protein [Yoonia ponticola]